MAASPAGKLEAPQSGHDHQAKGVDDRDAANLLTNCEIVVDHRSCLSLKRVTTTGKT